MTTFFINLEGHLFGCGKNVSSDLGLEDVRSINTFEQINEYKFRSISTSEHLAFAIDEHGFIWNICQDKNISSRSSISERFKMISCGDTHTIAIDEEGNLWGYGNNRDNQLSLGDCKETEKFEKLPISDTNKFISVSCGVFHTMAIDEYGYLWGCGCNLHGQLGLITYETNIKLSMITANQKFKIVSCGDFYTMAIDENGNLWGHGSFNDAKLELPLNNRFVSISCGNFHSIAIDENGYLWSCGLNTSGQLGFGDYEGRYKFEKVLIEERFVMVACVCDCTFAVDENECLWGCGDNECGQLGLGDNDNRKNFEKVENIEKVRLLVNNQLSKKPGSNTKGSHKLIR